MKRELREGLRQELLEPAGKEVAEEIREETIRNLNRSYQGAEELPRYVSEVKRSRDAAGRYADGFVFTIDHPTAPLHERGGYIEPRYANAMSVGWDRDGFYECLDDCNEYVYAKHPVRNASYSVKSDVE